MEKIIACLVEGSFDPERVQKKVDILYESDFVEITYVETVCTVTRGSSREKNY